MQGNEEAWASTFPVGLKYADTKRGPVQKLGGIPPIRLVPPVHEADESEATVTINRNPGKGLDLSQIFASFTLGYWNSAKKMVLEGVQ